MQSALAFVVRHLTNQCFTVVWIVFLGAFSEKTLCFPRKVVFACFHCVFNVFCQLLGGGTGFLILLKTLFRLSRDGQNSKFDDKTVQKTSPKHQKLRGLAGWDVFTSFVELGITARVFPQTKACWDPFQSFFFRSQRNTAPGSRYFTLRMRVLHFILLNNFVSGELCQPTMDRYIALVYGSDVEKYKCYSSAAQAFLNNFL